jgi:hypothetical protein
MAVSSFTNAKMVPVLPTTSLRKSYSKKRLYPPKRTRSILRTSQKQMAPKKTRAWIFDGRRKALVWRKNYAQTFSDQGKRKATAGYTTLASELARE